MGGNGNGNDSMRVEREWEQESHSRTPLNGSLPTGLSLDYLWADCLSGSPEPTCNYLYF